MIVAAGLTPAWQQILLFDQFRPGEVNRAREAHWCASGKVLNVGIALRHLGADSSLVALIGGPPKAQIDLECERLGVRTHWVAAAAPTRVCTTILDAATGRTTELVENAGPVTDGELRSFRETFNNAVSAADVVVLTGSLPAGAPATFYRDLLTATSARAVLDARGPELLAALEEGPFLVKPNREELGLTFGRPVDLEVELRAAMNELNERGATWVVVTQGKQPVWISSAGRFYSIQPPTVRVVNPIGCGDCLAAGLAAALSRGQHPLEAVRHGIAAAAENARHLLPGRIDPLGVAASARGLTPLDV